MNEAVRGVLLTTAKTYKQPACSNKYTEAYSNNGFVFLTKGKRAIKPCTDIEESYVQSAK